MSDKESASNQLRQWRFNKTSVLFKLQDNSSMIGTIQWFDKFNIAVETDDIGPITILKHSILWYGEKDKLNLEKRSGV